MQQGLPPGLSVGVKGHHAVEEPAFQLAVGPGAPCELVEVILRPGLVARGMLRLPCAALPKNRPTDLCKPIFSKKRTRSRSSISAAVAFAASAPMACAVHAAPTAEAVYCSQLVDPAFPRARAAP